MADKKVRYINLNNQILTLGGDGILSFPDIATMASEPIANLQNGAIGWVDSEQKYFQWLDTNEISEMGYWKELIFGSDFQISDPTTSADDDRYKGKVVQYVGEDDLTTGFKKGYFYESRLSNTINYVETVCTETSTGTYYILRDGEYLEVVLLGDGTTFDPNETYYKKQDVEVYGWFYINALRVDTELADTDYAIANKTVKAKFEEVIQDYTDKNDELREYVDNDLTTSLQQYTDNKIDDTDEEIFEDKTWSSSKINTKFEEVTQTITDGNDALTEYVDTSLEGYEKKFVECTFEEYKQMETDGTVESDVDYIITTNESGALLSGLDTNHGDSEISTYEVIEELKSDVENLIDDTDLTSTTSTFSANKIKNAVTYSFDTQSGNVKYVKFKPSVTAISVADIYGGKIEILGASKSVSNPDYKTVKVVRLSYGDWGSYDATQVPSVVHTKIGELYYYPTDEYYYLKLYNYASFTMTGLATAPEMVTSLPAEESAMTLIPESVFTTKSDLAAQTANRQVKTFDNTGASTEKWYKICSAITGGIGCNIKLTASRADSTATVQYFSALFRDNRYRYTSSYILRERTVYESELVAEYSAYIIADANNDIWVHIPSYGKAIIEIDTRAITIDGTAGTPVKDYVYSSFESQMLKDKFDKINIKQFNQPGSNTSFKYVTITSGGNGVGGLELNVPYAGKYMFSTPKSEPVYFGSSTHRGYTLNGWAWSDDGKTLYLRVAGFAPFSISVLGSVPKDTSPNNVVTISDMTSTAPEGVTFVSSPVYSNATTNDIVGSKTQYRGSRSIDISTGGKLTIIYSSEYASQAGCYMLLSNFNTEPLLIELGRTNIGQFSVTAKHKSQNVDTITVTAAGDEYSWYVLQF